LKSNIGKANPLFRWVRIKKLNSKEKKMILEYDYMVRGGQYEN